MNKIILSEKNVNLYNEQTRLEGLSLSFTAEEIRQELAKGNDVKISSFGTFSLRKKKARIGRNPKTGEEATITPRTVISFKPSHILRQAANSGKVVAKAPRKAKSK